MSIRKETPGALGNVRCVSFERVFPGPIERVWEFLTSPERLPGWFGVGELEPRVGGKVTLMGGHVRGTVTCWQPPTKLAYTWNVFSPGQEFSEYPESYLTIDLAAREDDVVLRLTHLPVLERFEKQNAMGWHTYLDMLGAALRGEPVADRGVYMAENAKTYGVDLGKLAS